MRLEHLKTSLLDMSEDELRAKIRAIRADRVIRKTTKAQKNATVRKRATTSDKMDKLLTTMSKEDLVKLLEEFE